MKMKKLLKTAAILAMAGVLGLSAVGCTVTPLYDDYTHIPAGELPAKQEGVDYSPLKRYDETVTIRVLGIDYDPIGNIPPTYNGADSGPANNAFNDLALQVLNIDLEYVSIVSGSNYETRLNALIGAGEVPDIFITSNVGTFEILRSNGLIADLGPSFWYLNEELQNFYLDDLYKVGLESCMQNGQLFAFPNLDNPNEAAQKLYIRQDWLDIVGKAVPTTYEELIDVARAFRDNAAAIAAASEGITAKDIVPIGITQELSVRGNNTAAGFFNIFGAQPGAFFEEDGEIIDSNTSPEMKAALAELHSLYSEGLIAQEFYTHTDAKVSNDIIAGKVGIVSGMWHAASYPLQSSVTNSYTPNAQWVSIELPPRNGVASVPVVDTMRLQSYTMVARDFEHPEALARLCNLFHDIFYSNDAQEKYGSLATPEGGFFYSWVPAKIWYTPYSMQSYYRVNEVFDELWDAGFRIDDATLAQMSESTFNWNNWYAQMETGQYKDIFNKLLIRERDNGFKYGYPYMQAIRNGKKTAQMNSVEKSGFGIYEQAISETGGYAYVSELSNGTKPSKREIFYGIQTPAMQGYNEYLQSSMERYFLAVITGQDSLDNWDDFVNTYNSNGGSEVLHQVKQWYEATR